MNRNIKRLIEEHQRFINGVLDDKDDLQTVSTDVLKEYGYKYYPKDKDELMKIIKDLVIHKHEMNLNCINISEITDMSDIFRDFSDYRNVDLSQLDISQWDVSHVTDFSRMFANCGKQLKLDLSNWDVKNGQKFSFMFWNCDSMDESDINTWTINPTAITTLMFDKDFDITDGIKIYDRDDLEFYLLTMITEHKMTDFNHVDVSDITDFSHVLEYCPANIDISKWDVSKGVNFEGMFENSSELKTLNIENWNVSNGKYFNCMFNNCEHLISCDLSKWNMSNAEDLSYMFNNCTDFNGNIKKWDVSNVKLFTSMLCNAESFNQDLSSWNVGKGENFDDMFYNTSSLPNRLFKKILNTWSQYPNVQNIEPSTFSN